MRNSAKSNLLVPEIREVMDIRQASDYLGISPDTLYKYASEAFVPAFKLGNRWRFKRSRLDEWMDRQSDQMTAQPEPVLPKQKKPVKAAAAPAKQACFADPAKSADWQVESDRVLPRPDRRALPGPGRPAERCRYKKAHPAMHPDANRREQP